MKTEGKKVGFQVFYFVLEDRHTSVTHSMFE